MAYLAGRQGTDGILLVHDEQTDGTGHATGAINGAAGCLQQPAAASLQSSQGTYGRDQLFCAGLSRPFPRRKKELSGRVAPFLMVA